jgi:hypothetical protein
MNSLGKWVKAQSVHRLNRTSGTANKVVTIGPSVAALHLWQMFGNMQL